MISRRYNKARLINITRQRDSKENSGQINSKEKLKPSTLKIKKLNLNS